MSDGYARNREFYAPLTKDVDVVVGTQDYNGVLVPRDANHTIFVQRIVAAITTHSDGKIWTFQDTAAVPVKIASYADVVVANVMQPPFAVDFGPNGTPLTQGKSLDIKGSGAGLGARIHIEAYQKLTGVGVPA